MGKRFNLFDKFGNDMGTATESSGAGLEGLILAVCLILTLGVFYLAYKLIIAIYESFKRMDIKSQRRFAYICMSIVLAGMLAFLAITLIQAASIYVNSRTWSLILPPLGEFGAVYVFIRFKKRKGINANKKKQLILGYVLLSIITIIMGYTILSGIQGTIPSSSTGSVNSICGQALVPHLTIGQNAVVTQDGDSLALRTGGGLSQSRITVLRQGTTVKVIGGPSCNDGYNWWQLQTRYGTGWAVESNSQSYWLQEQDR